MVTDPISDYIIKIKNAAIVGKHDVIVFPYSNIKAAITDLLEKEGFIKNVTKKVKKGNKTIEVELVFVGEKAKVEGVERISKPSKRVYAGSTSVAPVKNGFGRVVISTSKGVMTDKDARKEKVGGELLFKIW